MPDADGNPYLDRALADGAAQISGEGRAERIRYIAADHSERWADPEEKVRAELWAELLYKHGYAPERIGFEVPVPSRTPNFKADLVLYEDDALKSPWFVFECKKAEVSDAEFAQAVEQSCGNRGGLAAPYCGAVAGLTRRFLRFDAFPAGERDANHIADVPIAYGRPAEWRFYKNKPGADLAAVPREALRAAIRKCHQTLWEGGRRSPIAAFGEFSKLVFVKHRDEKDLVRKDGAPYEFQRKGGEPPAQLHARVAALYRKEQAREPDVFTESINIDAPILAQCVEHLEGISLDRTELDTKGVAFEEFMGGFFKGDFGQYFTPRELIALAVEMLDPQRDDLVLDPACGSGGFLLYALDHVRREAESRSALSDIDKFRFWHEFAQNNLFGVEINDELARVAKMNMIIHDDGHTNIVGHDALDFVYNMTYKNRGLAREKFDLILTNPPFGAAVKRAEKPEHYVDQFDLAKRVGKGSRAAFKSEILFLERVHDFLKPGTGRAAVALPDGVLTNSSLQSVRDWLLSKFQLLAVVSLPQFAFSHYDAGVKASIVFLRRLAKDETARPDAPVFMALAENIGYDATGRKTFETSVESETPQSDAQRGEKIEIHRCDLFDYRVHYEWTGAMNPDTPGWSERRREIIPDTGVAGRWREFQRNPAPFLA